MKNLIAVFMVLIVGGGASFAQTNFFTNVTNLWWTGHKSNVLEMANARLAMNSNDIAGLILKAEYHLAFSEEDALSNAFLRVLQVGDTITTTNFVKRWWSGIGRYDVTSLLEDIAENPMTPQQIQMERPKGFLTEKPLPSEKLLKALHDDGYFQ